MIELLKDEHVLKELKQLLYPQEMANQLDMLTTKLEQLTEHLATTDAKIATLETTINKLETKIDDQEQYSRRANIGSVASPSTRFAPVPLSYGSGPSDYVTPSSGPEEPSKSSTPTSFYRTESTSTRISPSQCRSSLAYKTRELKKRGRITD